MEGCRLNSGGWNLNKFFQMPLPGVKPVHEAPYEF